MKTKWVWLSATSILIVVLDQVTKVIVERRFVLGESLELVSGFFNLTSVRNTGAAFGILATAPDWFRVPFFIAVPILALGSILWVFRSVGEKDRLSALAFAGVLGGALGNLIDRARLGYVIDFLDFHYKHWHFPAFNVADITICIGVGLLMILSFNQTQGERQSASDTH